MLRIILFNRQFQSLILTMKIYFISSTQQTWYSIVRNDFVFHFILAPVMPIDCNIRYLFTWRFSTWISRYAACGCVDGMHGCDRCYFGLCCIRASLLVWATLQSCWRIALEHNYGNNGLSLSLFLSCFCSVRDSLRNLHEMATRMGFDSPRINITDADYLKIADEIEG